MDSDVIQFIHKMSGMWSRTNPGAVAEDMRLAGYTVVSAPKSEQSDRLDKLEAQCTDLFRQLRGVRESRNDGLATLNKGIDDLRQRIEGRFAKMAEEHALDVTATDARTDRLSGIIDEHEGRLNLFAIELGGKANGRQAYETEKNKISKAMLDQLVTHCGHPECVQCYPKPGKPTIKGGWVNFYPEGGWSPTFHATECDADIHAGSCRIACIRIPDFTEGEGL